MNHHLISLIKTLLRAGIVLLLSMTLLTGIIYPLVVTIGAQLLFPIQANGSLIIQNGQVIGSTLIGQSFDEPRYFWGRLSATSPNPYNAGASQGANLAPTSQQLIDAAKARLSALQAAEEATGSTNTMPVPVDLVTHSASGLDPHISLAAAQYQAPRVAKARHLPLERVQQLIAQQTELPTFGLFGEPRLNVLQLNMALDQLSADVMPSSK